MKKDHPSREIFDKLVDSPYPAFAFVAGVKLDVFTPLGDGPKTAEELAAVLNVDPRKLSPLLYALVVAGVLTLEDGAFANTPESDHYLVKGREEYIGNLCEAFEKRWHWALQTAESIRTGKPQAGHDYAAMSGAERDTFFRDLHPNALETGRMLVDRLNLAERRHLVDVGGGSGGLAIAACERCPQLLATVIELPSVAPITETIVAESGLSGRVAVVTHDVVASPPPTRCDVAVFRAVLQVLTHDDARDAVINVGQTIEAGGTMCILSRVLQDSRLEPEQTVAQNLVFLNIYDGGQAYTVGEHRTWLRNAGFPDFEMFTRPDGRSVITATKPATADTLPSTTSGAAAEWPGEA
ncbi:MAG: methyltransferase [Rhodospirillaceae bacterium]|nr:methyltransferase [Rhodospirillaceae bacterium]